MLSHMGMSIPGMPPSRPQSGFPAPGVTNTTPQPNRNMSGTPQPQHTQGGAPPAQQQPPLNPFDSLFPPAAGGAGVTNSTNNPFMGLFGPPGFGSPPAQHQNPAQPQAQQPPLNPFGMQSPPMNPQINQPLRNPASPPQGPGSPYGSPPAQQPLFGQQPGVQQWMDMYNMLNQYVAGGQGAAANPMSPTGQVPFPASLARATADSRPIEERFQVALLHIISNFYLGGIETVERYGLYRLQSEY